MVTHIMSRMRRRKQKNRTRCVSYYLLDLFVHWLFVGRTIPLKIGVIQNSLDWINSREHVISMDVWNNKEIVIKVTS